MKLLRMILGTQWVVNRTNESVLSANSTILCAHILRQLDDSMEKSFSRKKMKEKLSRKTYDTMNRSSGQGNEQNTTEPTPIISIERRSFDDGDNDDDGAARNCFVTCHTTTL